jgi:hypothetical protein
MSNLKTNLQNVKNFDKVNLTRFSDKVNDNFGKALEILIPNWVSNGIFGLTLYDVANTTDKVAFSAYTINPLADAKIDFQSHIINNLNTSDDIKKLGQFEINTITNELGFKSSTTKTEVNWNNYPCVTSNPDKKEIKATDGSITYEISGFTYFGNGTRKDKSGNSSSFSCSQDKKTIVSATTSSLSSLNSSTSNSSGSNVSSGEEKDRSYWERQLINKGAGGSATSQIKNVGIGSNTTTVTEKEIKKDKPLVEELTRMKKLMNL